MDDIADLLPEGASQMVLAPEGVPLRVHLYRPPGPVAEALLLFHGNSRNAADYRDFAIPLARQAGLLVVAPEFDRRRFSNSRYHRGGIVARYGRLRPAEQRTTRLVPRLIDWVRGLFGPTLPCRLLGFSAGGQFLSRVAAVEPLPAPAPRRIVIASPSSHVLPLGGHSPKGERAPYGLGGLDPTPEALAALQRRYLGLPLTLCVGAEDDWPTDPLLARSRAARRQGPDRISRARTTFETGRAIAAAEGWEFGWRLLVLPGVGHSAAALLDPCRAARVLDLPALPGCATEEGAEEGAGVRET